MFTEKQLENYAKALIWGVTKMKKGGFGELDVVKMNGHVDTLPLMEVLHRELLKQGQHPHMRLLPTETMDIDYFTYASNAQLDRLLPWWKEEYDHIRGNIFISGPTSITHLKDMDSAKQQRSAKSMKPFRKFLQEQELKGLFSWTVGIWPTECKAEKAGMTLEEFKDQIVNACYLDSDDVVGNWEATQAGITQAKDWLNKTIDSVDYYHMISDHINLKVTPGISRRFLGGGGANIPSFEVFVSPDWRGTSGVFYADQPSYKNGNLVKGVRLEFKKGIVVNATAEEGEGYLISTLDTDEDSRKVGEFSLTDIRHSKINRFMADTLFDENFGGKEGNSHIAVGCAYPDTYSGDQSKLTEAKKKELGFTESVVHWDLINTESKIVTAVMKDGKHTIIYKNGMFTI